jgi:hypothetical protein
MLPGDFDGDGHLDVAVAGNSYAEDTREGWHDASIGGVLLGDGAGGFRWSSGSESGFFVDGDAKGVAELALDDGQALVLVTQNDDRLLAFTATSPTPGRRVRVRPLDAWALLTLADGRTRRHELHHGSTYLSQSSRTLVLPPGVREAVVYDSRGRSRTLLTDEPDDGGR